MKLLWNKLSNVFLKDWASARFIAHLDLELLSENLKVSDLSDFKNLKNTLTNLKSLEDLLSFLCRMALLPQSIALEIAIRHNYWSLVKELSSWQEESFAYLGKNPKSHLHEAIFSQFLTLISQDKLTQADFPILLDLKVNAKYLGSSLFFRFKQMFIEELKIRQYSFASSESEKLRKMIEFLFFLKDQNLVTPSYFDSFIEEALNYNNFFSLRYFSPYLRPEHTLIVLSSLKSSYIQEFFFHYANLFQLEGYVKYVIKCFMEDCTAYDTELYLILDWLREKNLDNFEKDNSLVQIIVSGRFHSAAKVPLITTLMELNLVPRNEILLNALSHQVSLNPLLMEALSVGGDEKALCREIFGCHSAKARVKLSHLISSLKENRSQNTLILNYIAINKLKINRNVVENWSFEKASCHDLSLDLLKKVIFVLQFFKPHRQLKLLQSVASQQSKEIESVYQILTIISNHKDYPYKLPLKPENIILLDQELSIHKKYLETIELNLGINRFADEFESRKFQDYEIKVPRTARDLMMTGKEFNNCLYQSHHAAFVSKILNRQLMIITMHGPKKYCISFDPYQKKIEEAKIMGQIMMETELRHSLTSFLKELNFGQDWLCPSNSRVIRK